MERWTALVFAGLLVVVTGAMFAMRGRADGKLDPKLHTASAVAADAGVADAAESDAASSALTDASAPTGMPGLPADFVGFGASDAGGSLLTGQAPPALTGDTPKTVVFGVILVQYKGAQGAPPNARSRDAALELAKQLAAEARTDFKAAVAKGDSGSMENAGRMPRGMLEPAPEYVLFSLPKEGVSDPVDTPRGFWIARRLD
jgi:PPIC-type PPIASE domain